MDSQTKCPGVRVSNPCDACVVRRVKCGVQRPCEECRKRGLDCTSLRQRKKRGPKGPRESTSERVRRKQELQQRQLQQQDVLSGSTQYDSEHSSLRGSPGESAPVPVLPESGNIRGPPEESRRVPLSAYCKFFAIFRERLYPIWPVVVPDRLMGSMALDENDYESYALAAALCAATISQLRLEEHTESKDDISSLTFALEAERFKSLYDYRERCDLPSLLVAFFLHMYYSNANKLRTATLLLREAITCAHVLQLHHLGSTSTSRSAEQSLRVRVYWLLFISEMTFAAQNDLPAIMQPIPVMPDDEDDPHGADLHAFISLTRLFSLLRHPTRGINEKHGPSERAELAEIQKKLAYDGDDSALNETQRVDLCVTRQWIRILTWEYMTRHFPMSTNSEDPAFSLLLPVNIGYEMLSFFRTVGAGAICAHGYGMELKVFRMADAIVDIMMCSPGVPTSDGMELGMGDVLVSLQQVVEMVGGQQSEFFGKLQRRLGTLRTKSITRNLLPDDDAERRAIHEATVGNGYNAGGSVAVSQ